MTTTIEHSETELEIISNILRLVEKLNSADKERLRAFTIGALLATGTTG